MSGDEHYRQAVAILRAVAYPALATVNEDGTPWSTPVSVAYDESLRFYWYSDKDSGHSGNIRRTNRVAAVFYDSVRAGYGVYVQGAARQLDDADEVMHARRTVESRKGRTAEPADHEKFRGDAPRRFYELLPGAIFVNERQSAADGLVSSVRIKLRPTVIAERLRHGD